MLIDNSPFGIATAHAEDCRCAAHQQVQRAQKVRLLWLALALVGSFSVLELAVSWSSGSLALLAEAGHMISDCGALAIALLATWMARWLPTKFSFWSDRHIETGAALINGLGLLAIALGVGWEAIQRLQVPAADIVALPMVLTAALGVGVNLVNISLLHDHSHDDLNLRGAVLHMAADAVGSVGVIMAAIAVYVFDWLWADSLISLLVAGLMVVGSVPLIRASWRELMP